jgi:hypothetical protein
MARIQLLFTELITTQPDNSFTYIVTPDKFHSKEDKMARLGDANSFLQENWVRVYESAYLNSKGGYGLQNCQCLWNWATFSIQATLCVRLPATL